MKGNDFSKKISCPNFHNQYSRLLDDRKKINRSVRSMEKTIYAEDYEEHLKTLLNCQNYDLHKPDCRNCRIVANLKKKSAEILINLQATA